MRRLKDSEVTPELKTFAVEALKELVPKGIGSVKEFYSNGRRYEARLEEHTYYGADPARLHKPHPGITLWGDLPLILPGQLPMAPPQRGQGDVAGVAFKQARNFTRAGRTHVGLVVIHTAECNETEHAAENLAAWAAGSSAPRASWHYAIDSNSITQSVLERDIAWHAPGANGRSIGLEHAGRAGQDLTGWSDAYSQAVLQRSTQLVAGICNRWSIPIRKLAYEQVCAGMTGICGHYEVSQAFKRSTHWDPGPAFPWSRYLEMIHAADAAGQSGQELQPLVKVRETIGLGAQGETVREWQRLIGVKVDGDFGPDTLRVSKAWQAMNGLKPDGIVGPETWAAADKLLSKVTDKVGLPEIK